MRAHLLAAALALACASCENSYETEAKMAYGLSGGIDLGNIPSHDLSPVPPDMTPPAPQPDMLCVLPTELAGTWNNCLIEAGGWPDNCVFQAVSVNGQCLYDCLGEGFSCIPGTVKIGPDGSLTCDTADGKYHPSCPTPPKP